MAETDLTAAQRQSNALLVEHFQKQVTAANAYTTVITGVGYAGELTLWNGSRAYLEHGVVLATGTIIGVSLMVFVLFEMAKTATQVQSNRAFERTVADHYWSADFPTRVTESNARVIRSVDSLNKWQPLAFWFTTLTGFGAAVWLAIDMGATALRLWQTC